MSVAFEERLCPMCGGTGRNLHRAAARGGRRFEIVRCDTCRFVFVANPLAQSFHQEQSAPTRIPERARHRQIKRVCDRILARRLKRGECPVVEVGAGWGGLAQVFSRDARYRYVGFEPSAARAEFCRARGFDVREGPFRGNASVGAADAVIFDNVLEHVEHPQELVRGAVASLRDGGVLIVIVPNLNDLRQLHRPWRERHHWQPHCHINYFRAADVRRLFERHGMTCRFFGLEALGANRGDIGLLPRVLADAVGVHVFGLNCYGVKSSSA